jgi:Styrene monooxygenase A putative substrate binding domain
MTTIGIVGTGIAGLHLALYLQQLGVSATLYADRTPDGLRASRLLNTQGFQGSTRARDASLGLDLLSDPTCLATALHLRVAGEHPIEFTGALVPPSVFIDMRFYIPHLMEIFGARGGTVVVAPPGSADDVARLAERHDLMVVATGRSGLAEMFPRVPERSPYQEAPRRIVAGLFRGIRVPEGCVVEYNLLPGVGEAFEVQVRVEEGVVPAVVFEAIPGGPLEPFTRMRYEDDPARFDAAALATLREYLPATYARTDPAAFGLRGPLDAVYGALVPTVRRGFAPLPGGRFAVALGDARVSFDPVTGQGANAASRTAFVLGDLVAEHAREGGRFDEAFCARADELIWENVKAAAEWTNAFLQPPPPHAIGLLIAAAQNKKIADAFATNFDDPDRQWQVLSSPEATAAFIASEGARTS